MEIIQIGWHSFCYNQIRVHLDQIAFSCAAPDAEEIGVERKPNMRIEWNIQAAYYAIGLRKKEARDKLKDIPKEYRDDEYHYQLGKLAAFDEAMTIIKDKIEDKVR